MAEISEGPKRSLPAKVATAFAVGAVLSFGLCGVSVLGGPGGDNWWGRTANLCASCFFACVIGLVASVIWWRVSKSGRGGQE